MPFLGFTIHDVDYYGQGEGAVYAKQFGCTGNENSILDCSGNEGCCSHSKDIGLTCQYACEDGDIRLVGGDNEWEGRVEVCYNRRWGTICDDSWGENDARVACKMAGFPWRGKRVCIKFASFYSFCHSLRCCCNKFCKLWPRCWTYSLG